MRKHHFVILCIFVLGKGAALLGHCQMPCGIYHDTLVMEIYDQYLETMNKAVHELQTLKDDNPKDRNQFVRWVMNKDDETNRAADLLFTYFLQQKIKPDAPEAAKQVLSLHKVLFQMVKVKQNVDQETVDLLAKEWEQFKTLYGAKKE